MKPASIAWLVIFLLSSVNAGAGNLEASVSSPNGKPVEDAAVVILPSSGTFASRNQTATIEQRNREFIPFVSIVQTGTRVEFPNRDKLKHHVYSFSPVKIFEIKLYAGKPMQPVLFDKPGEVAVGCNIHDWMEAYILVVDTSYFAKTDRNGKALIRDLPPGRYRLRLWHPLQKVEPPLRDIEVGADPIKLSLSTDVTPRVIKPKPPLDSDKY